MRSMFADEPDLSFFLSDDLKSDINAFLVLLSAGIDSKRIEGAVRRFSVCKTDFATVVAGHSRGGGLVDDCKEACVSLQADVVNQRELTDLTKATITLGELDPSAADSMVALSAAAKVVAEHKSNMMLILQTVSPHMRESQCAAIARLNEDFAACEASAMQFQQVCFWLRFGKVVAGIGGIMSQASSDKDIANPGAALRGKPLARALSDPGELGMHNIMSSDAFEKHKMDIHNLRSMLAMASKFFDSLQVDGEQCVTNLAQGDQTGFLSALFSYDLNVADTKYLSYDALRAQVKPPRSCVHSISSNALEDLASTQLKVIFGSMTLFFAKNASTKKLSRFPWSSATLGNWRQEMRKACRPNLDSPRFLSLTQHSLGLLVGAHRRGTLPNPQANTPPIAWPDQHLCLRNRSGWHTH